MAQRKPEKANSFRPDTDPYNLTKKFAAEFLGVSQWTIDRYVLDRKLSHVKLNNHLVRFRLSDLIQFAEKQRVA